MLVHAANVDQYGYHPANDVLSGAQKTPDSLAERERRRALMEADPAWPVYRQALLELDVVIEQSTKILRTTAFSPTIDFDQQQTA